MTIRKISPEVYQTESGDTRAFSPCDATTWPMLLTDAQVAAICQLAVATVRKKAAKGTFVPAPIAGTKPRRYRKVDVLRYAEGARGGTGLMRRAG